MNHTNHFISNNNQNLRVTTNMNGRGIPNKDFNHRPRFPNSQNFANISPPTFMNHQKTSQFNPSVRPPYLPRNYTQPNNTNFSPNAINTSSPRCPEQKPNFSTVIGSGAIYNPPNMRSNTICQPSSIVSRPLFNLPPNLNSLPPRLNPLPPNNLNRPPSNLLFQAHEPVKSHGNVPPRVNIPVPQILPPPISTNFNNMQSPPFNYLRNDVPSKSELIHLPQSNNFSHQMAASVSLTQSGPLISSNVQSFPVNHQFTTTMSFPVNSQVTNVMSNEATFVVPFLPMKPGQEKESKILRFLEKFAKKKEKTKSDMTVKQFRKTLKHAFFLLKDLNNCKENLKQLLNSEDGKWNTEVKKALQYQNQLIQTCNILQTPKYLDCVKKKLELIKKKRSVKKKIKQNALIDKEKKFKQREELHQEIDKWLDSIKEKNLKLKREAEMKKEADIILSEVRRKIHEAKRTIERLKVFEKLRNARQDNATKKGLFLPEHDERFEKNISDLKQTILRQLSHYESEEKAMKVMLEAEQEGQLEEEALWKIKKLKTLQQRRQRNIMESLFGELEEPEQEDPLYLFYQFQNSGSKSIENLAQIRHQWDMHINETGETIPLKWVVPILPNSAAWEVFLQS